MLKTPVSLLLGHVGRLMVSLVPDNVENTEDHVAKTEYTFYSDLVRGPINSNLITRVSLDKYDILPGQYQIITTYNVLTGFGLKSAQSPNIQTVTLIKDDLKVICNAPFELGSVDFGSVYTFENKDDNSFENI